VKRKRLLTLAGSICLILVLAALLLPACAKPAPPPAPAPAPAPPKPAPAPAPTPKPEAPKVFEWKFQSHWPAASTSYIPLKAWLEDDLANLTDGRLKIEMFPAPTFIPTKELLEAWRGGTLDGGTGSAAYWQSIIPIEAVAANCPLSFKLRWEAEYFHFVLGFEEAVKKAHEEYGVMYWSEKIYPTAFIASRPIKTVGDFKGLKIRSSGRIADVLKIAGASPTMIPGAELYTSLATGVVDAAHWGAAQGALSMKLYEPCKYYHEPNLAYCGTDAIMVSKKSWDALPEDLKKLVDMAFKERCWKRSCEYIMGEMDAIVAMKTKYGVTVVQMDEELQKVLATAATEIWDDTAKMTPENAHWIDVMKDFLRKLGYID